MLIEIWFGNEKANVDLLDGVVHVGGGPNDEIRVQGMAPSLLTLNLLGERLMVTAARAVTIGGVRFPAHVPRLVVAGESLQLPCGIALRQVPSKGVERRGQKGTACVIKELVGDAFDLGASRAASLTCLTGHEAGCTFPLALQETLVGRGEGCAVKLRDRSVSRNHARVVRRAGLDYLEALPRTHGLFLNGEPVTTAAALSPGDVIELGHSLLRYEAPGLADEADERIEATVLVKAASVEIEEIDPEQIVETRPLPTPRRIPLDLVLIASGTALALIGLGVTISACC